MMADEQPEQEKEGTPKGAVEVDEKDLDKAEGGISSYSVPSDSFSLNFTKTATTDPLVQKVAPTEVLAGPGAGPHVVPEKKI
jgi:hypothetical protein